MKKILLTSALVSTIILAGATTASAATDVKNTSTPVGIEFGTGDDWEQVPGPYRGVLTLVHKPTAFNFGKNVATGGIATFKSTSLGNSDSSKQWLTVNDDRENDAGTPTPGDTDGYKGGAWVLKAKMDELKSGNDTLPGTLSMKLGKIQQYAMNLTVNGNGEDVPAAPIQGDSITEFPGADTGGVAFDPAVVNNTLELVAGAPAETAIMSKATADQNKVGVATEIRDVTLSGQTQKNMAGKTFSSQVTWTLYTGV